MSEVPIVIVGAGMAGTAAAWAASREGRQVVLFHDRAGASALYAGTLELEPWDSRSVEAHHRNQRAPDDENLRAFLAALGGFRLGQEQIATASGVVRTTLGADQALLDLTSLKGKRVAVADVGRDDWDAPLMAKTLGASKWAERAHTTFVPVFVKTLRSGHERRIAPYDFAALHDDQQRGASLAEALKFASQGVDGWLLGPWLGLEAETVTVLRRLVPLPLGETTSPMGGPAGARFERARERLFHNQRIDVRSARLTQVSPRAGRWAVELTDDAGQRGEIEARAVVLATGGVGAGGLRFSAQPARRERGFELPFQAPVLLGLDGEVQGGAGSLYGPSLETLGLGVLERAGILADANGRPQGLGSEESGLFVAGDAVAGRPRTMLEAAIGGLAAGIVAARV